MTLPPIKADAGFTTANANGYVKTDILQKLNGDSWLAGYATTAAVSAGYQPLDSDLTAIAALTTTAFGRSILEVANAAAATTLISALPLAGGTLTGALTLNAAGVIAGAATVSATEVSYLDGVTSAIQTQIDAKLATATAASTYLPLAGGTLTGGLSGTTATFSGAITVGTGGPKIKNSSGTIQFRNNADSAFSGIQLTNVIIGSTGFTMGTSDDYNLTFTTPYAATTEFVSGQSGQFSSLATKTYEGKLAGLKHYDVANANGRLCQLFSSPGVVFSFAPSGVELLRMDGFGVSNLSMPSTALLRWTSGIASAAADLVLTRDAAGVLAQRNSTNAQTLRVYGSYTDASNYVRASLSASTTSITLAAETAGSGADDLDVNITPAGVGRCVLASTSIASTNSSSSLEIKDNGSTSVGGAISLVKADSTPMWRFGLRGADGSLTDDFKISRLNSAWYTTLTIEKATGNSTFAGGITATTGTFSGAVKSVPSASVTLSTNGQLEIEMTSNTNGNICYRGSDGTTRRFNFTVA